MFAPDRRRPGSEGGANGAMAPPAMMRVSPMSSLTSTSGTSHRAQVFQRRSTKATEAHASIGTTQVYTALDFQHLAAVYDAAHPRARRQGEVPGAGRGGSDAERLSESGAKGGVEDGDSVRGDTGDGGLAGRPDARAQGTLKKP